MKNNNSQVQVIQWSGLANVEKIKYTAIYNIA